MEDEMMDDESTTHTMLEENIEDMEDKLEHLEDYDNETQLHLLYHEIDHIVMHGITPNEDWYENRIKYIHNYQEVDWKLEAMRSYQQDDKIYELSLSIIDHIDQLVDEWSTSPTFNLCVYQRLLETIRTLWKYYSHEYGVMDMNNTVDVLDLMNSMHKI